MIATKPAARHFTDSGRESTYEKRTDKSSGSTKDVLLVEVPTQIFLGHPAAQQRGRWQGMFDIAVWLRTPLGVREPLQLLLKYWDDNDAKKIVLDRCYPGSHRTVLLNASFSLTATGQIRRAGLYLKDTGRPSSVYLDEWHLIPQNKSSRGVR